MSVISFPHGRPVPPPQPAADDLLALEIEIARARLAQINFEVRQAKAMWGWWYFKRAVFWGLALWLLTTFASAAKADSISKSFYDRNGSFAGSSVTRGNAGSYYDGRGRFSGSSVTYGNQTRYYDNAGRYSGSTINTGPRR